MEQPYLFSCSVNLGDGGILSQLRQSSMDLHHGAVIDKEELTDKASRLVELLSELSKSNDEETAGYAVSLFLSIIDKFSEQSREYEHIYDLCKKSATSNWGIVLLISICARYIHKYDGLSTGDPDKLSEAKKIFHHYFDQINERVSQSITEANFTLTLDGVQFTGECFRKVLPHLMNHVCKDPIILRNYIDAFVKRQKIIKEACKMIEYAVNCHIYEALPESVFKNIQVLSGIQSSSVLRKLIELMPLTIFEHMYWGIITTKSDAFDSSVIATILKKCMQIPNAFDNEAAAVLEEHVLDIKPKDMTKELLEYLAGLDVHLSHEFTPDVLDQLYAPDRMDRGVMVRVIHNITTMDPDEVCEVLFDEPRKPNQQIVNSVHKAVDRLGTSEVTSPQLFHKTKLWGALLIGGVVENWCDMYGYRLDKSCTFQDDMVADILSAVLVEFFEDVVKIQAFYDLYREISSHSDIPIWHLMFTRNPDMRERIRNLNFLVPDQFWRMVPSDELEQLAIEARDDPARLGIYLCGLIALQYRFEVIQDNNILPFPLVLPELTDEEANDIFAYIIDGEAKVELSPNMLLFIGISRYSTGTVHIDINGMTQKLSLLFLVVALSYPLDLLMDSTFNDKIILAMILRLFNLAANEMLPFGSLVKTAIMECDNSELQQKLIDITLRCLTRIIMHMDDEEDVQFNLMHRYRPIMNDAINIIAGIICDPKFLRPETEFAQTISKLIGRWTARSVGRFEGVRNIQTLLSTQANNIWNLFMECPPRIYNHDVLLSANKEAYSDAILRSFGSRDNIGKVLKVFAASLTQIEVNPCIFDDPVPVQMAIDYYIEHREFTRIKKICDMLASAGKLEILFPYLTRPDITTKVKMSITYALKTMEISKIREIFLWKEVLAPMIKELDFVIDDRFCNQAVELVKKLLQEDSVIVNHWLFLLQRSPGYFSVTSKTILNILSHHVKNNREEDLMLRALGKMFIVPEGSLNVLFQAPEPPELDEMSDYVFSFAQNMIDSCCQEKNWKLFVFTKMIANAYPFIFARCDIDKVFETYFEMFTDRFITEYDSDTEEAKLIVANMGLISMLLISPVNEDKFLHWITANIDSFTISQYAVVIDCLRELLGDTSRVWGTLVYFIRSNFFAKLDDVTRQAIDCDTQAGLLIALICIKSVVSVPMKLPTLKQHENIDMTQEIMKHENPFQLAYHNSIAIPPSQKPSSSGLKATMTTIWGMTTNDDYQSITKFPGAEEGVGWRPGPNMHIARIAQISSDEHPMKPITPPEGIDGDALNSLPEKMKSTVLYHTLPVLPTITRAMRKHLVHKPAWVMHYLTETPRPRFLLPSAHLAMLHETVNELLSLPEDEEPELMTWNADWFSVKDFVCDILDRKLNTMRARASFMLAGILRDLWKYDEKFISVCVDKLVHAWKTERMFSAAHILLDILTDEKEPTEALTQAIEKHINEIVWMARRVRSVIHNIMHILERVSERSPRAIIQTICVMLMDKSSDTVQSGFRLAIKLPEANRQEIAEYVNRAININMANIGIMPKVLESFPFLVESRRNVFIEILDQQLQSSVPMKVLGKFTPPKLALVSALLNIFVPQRTHGSSGIMESQPIDSQQAQSGHVIPLSFWRTAPDVWGVIEKNLEKIKAWIQESPLLIETTFKFLQQYPEILSLTEKVRYFKVKQRSKTIPTDKLRICVRRDHILDDSFSMLCNTSPEKLRGKIRVIFQGEPGIDAGGLRKEWFTLLVKELFNPNYGLFTLSSNLQSFQPNPTSYANPDHKRYFRFAGRILGRALLEEIQLDAHLTTAFLKHILGRRLTLRDLEDADPELYSSLDWILKNDITDVMDRDFTADFDDIGVDRTIELKPDGANIAVTEENKLEYVELMVEHRLTKQISEQLKEFCDGFYSMIPFEDIRIFLPNELDMIICGIPKIDVHDLIENCELIHPYHRDHPVVELFFSIIETWSEENLAKLLIFVTGSSQVPLGGFKVFREDGRPICIAPGGKCDRLPVAHTCTNTLDLPEYESKEQMEEKLIYAIFECQGFGFH